MRFNLFVMTILVTLCITVQVHGQSSMTSIAPGTVFQKGGQTLNIYGTNMPYQNVPVKIGDADCSPVVVVTAGSHWRCTTPAGLEKGVHQVKVWFSTQTKPILVASNVSLVVTKDTFQTQDAALWKYTTSSAIPTTSCGSRSSPNSLWFGDARRSILTQDFYFTAGSKIPIEYYVRRGSGGYPCETPDGNENLVFFSGSRFGVASSVLDTNTPSGSSPTFTKKSLVWTVPQSGLWYFLFQQASYSGTSFDAWAVDDFQISLPGALLITNPDVHHSTGGSWMQMTSTGVSISEQSQLETAKALIKPVLQISIDGNVQSSANIRIDSIDTNAMKFSLKLPSLALGDHIVKASLDAGVSFTDAEPALKIVPYPTVTGITTTQSLIGTSSLKVNVTGTGFKATTWFKMGDRVIKGTTPANSTTVSMLEIPALGMDYCALCHTAGQVSSSASGAQSSCPTGQKLSSVHLAQENQLVQDALQFNGACSAGGWLGYQVRSGVTSWTDGSSTDYVNFMANAQQSSNADVYMMNSGKWNYTMGAGSTRANTCAVCKSVSFAHAIVSNISVSLDMANYKSYNIDVRFVSQLKLQDNVARTVAVNQDQPAVFGYRLSSLAGTYGAQLVLNCSQGSTAQAFVGFGTTLDVAMADAVHVTSSVIASINKTMDDITIVVKGSNTPAPGYDTCAVTIKPTIPVSNNSAAISIASTAIPIQGGGLVKATGSGFVDSGLAMYFADKQCASPEKFGSSTDMSCINTPTFPAPAMVKCFVLNQNKLVGTFDVVVFNLTSFQFDIYNGPTNGGTKVTLRATIDLPLNVPMHLLNATVSFGVPKYHVIGESYDANTKVLTFKPFLTNPQSSGLATVHVQLDGTNWIRIDQGFRFYESIVLQKVIPSVLIEDFVANDTVSIRTSFAVSYPQSKLLLNDQPEPVPHTLVRNDLMTFKLEGDTEDRIYKYTECPSGSQEHNGKCYKTFTGASSYANASKMCVDWYKYAKPTVVLSSMENDFVQGLLKSQGCVSGWMGMRGSTSASPVWLDNNQYPVGDYTNWANGQPANVNGNARLLNSTGKWVMSSGASGDCVVCQHFSKEAVEKATFKYSANGQQNSNSITVDVAPKLELEMNKTRSGIVTQKGTILIIRNVFATVKLDLTGDVMAYAGHHNDHLPSASLNNGTIVGGGRLLLTPVDNDPNVYLMIQPRNASVVYTSYSVSMSTPTPDGTDLITSVFPKASGVGIKRSLTITGRKFNANPSTFTFVLIGTRQCSNAIISGNGTTLVCQTPSNLDWGKHDIVVEQLNSTHFIRMASNASTPVALIVYRQPRLPVVVAGTSCNKETFNTFNTKVPQSCVDTFNGEFGVTRCGAQSGLGFAMQGSIRRLRSVQITGPATLTFESRPGSSSLCELPNSGEDLVLAFYSTGGSLLATRSISPIGQSTSMWTKQTFTYSGSATGYFQIAQTRYSSSTIDNWGIDNFEVTNPNSNANTGFASSWAPSTMIPGSVIGMEFLDPILPSNDMGNALDISIRNEGVVNKFWAKTGSILGVADARPNLINVIPNVAGLSTGTYNISLSFDGGLTTIATHPVQVATAYSSPQGYRVLAPTLKLIPQELGYIRFQHSYSSSIFRVYIGPHSSVCTMDGPNAECAMPAGVNAGTNKLQVHVYDTANNFLGVERFRTITGPLQSTLASVDVHVHKKMEWGWDMDTFVSKPSWITSSPTVTTSFYRASIRMVALSYYAPYWPTTQNFEADTYQLSFMGGPYSTNTLQWLYRPRVEYRLPNSPTNTSWFTWTSSQTLTIGSSQGFSAPTYVYKTTAKKFNDVVQFRIRPDTAAVTPGYFGSSQSTYMAGFRVNRGSASIITPNIGPTYYQTINTLVMEPPTVPGMTKTQVANLAIQSIAIDSISNKNYSVIAQTGKIAVVGNTIQKTDGIVTRASIDAVRVTFGSSSITKTQAQAVMSAPFAFVRHEVPPQPPASPTPTPGAVVKPSSSLTPGDVAGIVVGVASAAGVMAAAVFITQGKQNKGPLRKFFFPDGDGTTTSSSSSSSTSAASTSYAATHEMQPIVHQPASQPQPVSEPVSQPPMAQPMAQPTVYDTYGQQPMYQPQPQVYQPQPQYNQYNFQQAQPVPNYAMPTQTGIPSYDAPPPQYESITPQQPNNNAPPQYGDQAPPQYNF